MVSSCSTIPSHAGIAQWAAQFTQQLAEWGALFAEIPSDDERRNAALAGALKLKKAAKQLEPVTAAADDAEALAAIPRSAVLVNVGRGNAIDETALAERLEERRLAAAYLDVYRQEPLPDDSPLRTCGNALLMPHASAIAPNYLDLFVEEFIRRFARRYG